MKVFEFNDRMWWLAAREGKITGSRLKSIVVKRGTGKKIGFYELIAEKLGIPAEEVETPMERGSRLEKEAIARFSEETGKEVDTRLLLWTRDDNENIALSPDGVVIPKKGAVETEAVEVKCLSASRHIEAYLTQQVPDEYEYQVLQYFIVNEDLKTLYFVCYDPRFAMNPNIKLDFFYLTIQREDVIEQVNEILEYERTTLKEVDDIVNNLTF
jgi:predicted phage-related endonuclease